VQQYGAALKAGSRLPLQKFEQLDPVMPPIGDLQQ
jgi:hypothetical protein